MRRRDQEQIDRRRALHPVMQSKSDEELYAIIRRGDAVEKRAAACALSGREGRYVFVKAVEFSNYGDPSVREQGAYILGQLGMLESPYCEESEPILMRTLENDPDENVRATAAIALGHHRSQLALPLLIKCAEDESAEIRYGVAVALGDFNAPEAARTLITLTSDSDDDVRNWATFCLGTCLDMDTPEIRDALLARLAENDAEIRGEALIGLAKRRDERVVKPLLRELSGEFHGGWCVEAAELMADSRFYTYLLALRERIDGPDGGFICEIDNAVAACKP